MCSSQIAQNLARIENRTEAERDNLLLLDPLDFWTSRRPWYCYVKGQLISKGLFIVFICTKKCTKIFFYFCPSLLKKVKYKKYWYKVTLFFLIWPFFQRLGQKYKNIYVRFVLQMKTLKSPFEINWPLEASGYVIVICLLVSFSRGLWKNDMNFFGTASCTCAICMPFFLARL